MATPFPPSQPAGESEPGEPGTPAPGGSPDPAYPGSWTQSAPLPNWPPLSAGTPAPTPPAQPIQAPPSVPLYPRYPPPGYPAPPTSSPPYVPPSPYAPPASPLPGGYPPHYRQPTPPAGWGWGWASARPRASTGMLVALVGGLGALSSAFFLPMLSFGPLGVTAMQAVGYLWSSTTVQTSIILLILAPGAAGAIITVVAGISVLSTRQRGIAAHIADSVVVALVAIGGLVCMGLLLASSQSSIPDTPSLLSYMGGGFWLSGFGLVAALIGGIAA